MTVRFDDVEGLIAYWNGNESVVNRAGNIVSDIQPGYDGVGDAAVTRADREGEIFYDEIEKIGELNAWYTETGASQAALHWQPSGGPPDLSEGCTILVVEQRYNLTGLQRSWMLRNATPADRGFVEDDGGVYRVRVNSDTAPTIASTTTDITIHAVSAEQGANNAAFYLRNDAEQEVYEVDNPSGSWLNDIAHWYLAGAHNQYVLRGKQAIVAIYNRKLSDGDIWGLFDLCQYWIDNGEAPDVPTSVTFGPCTTNQDERVTAWAWEESANGTDWAPVGTILTDTGPINEPSLTINSATLDMDGTYVRCTATDDLTVAESHSATLKVLEDA